MSRVGKLPINIPDNLTVTVKDREITFSGDKIKKVYQVSHGVEVIISNKQIKLSAKNKEDSDTSMFVGMDRSNIKNIVAGMQKPFKTTLEINGVGYKASVDKNALILTLGYSHELLYILPNNINAVFEKPNLIIVSGEDKILVGQVASEIISFRKPEPYKGKGVKVFGKTILRKEGKKK